MARIFLVAVLALQWLAGAGWSQEPLGAPAGSNAAVGTDRPPYLPMEQTLRGTVTSVGNATGALEVRDASSLVTTFQLKSLTPITEQGVYRTAADIRPAQKVSVRFNPVTMEVFQVDLIP